MWHAKHLLSSASAQGPPYLQDGTELGCAQGALPLVLAQAARVEGVPAQEVHCRQLQGAPAQGAPVVLEHPHLRSSTCEVRGQNPSPILYPRASTHLICSQASGQLPSYGSSRLFWDMGSQTACMKAH